MSIPVPDHLVAEGETYWASWGDKGWSAIRVIQVKRTKAIVERFNPKTNKALPSNATVRLDELVKRDETLLGADKPQKLPASVFMTIRSQRNET